MLRNYKAYFIPVLTLASLLSSSCSDAPKEETKAEAPVKPPAPITGRQGFQSTYPSARAWAQDAVPIQVRSMNLDSVKSEPGKAPLWEVTYVSATRSKMRIFTWSAVEEGNLHKGVFGAIEDSWAGPSGQDRPFESITIQADTPEALEKAIAESGEYLKKPGDKPPISYLLHLTPRYPEPTWVVLWGTSVGTAKHTVTIGASSGKMLAKE
jgi:hypothetical protein